MRPPDHEQKRADVHRAIGRQVVTFSELMREMRVAVARHIGSDETLSSTELVLGEMPAMQLANAFFGLCRQTAAYTTAESQVARALANEVGEAIQTRNDIAHGDWHVGYTLFQEGKVESLPPQVLRILPGRRAGAYKVLDLDVRALDALSDRLAELLLLIAEFGRLALGATVFRRDRTATTNEFRVGDVLVPVGGKHSEPVSVVREGPRADELVSSRYP